MSLLVYIALGGAVGAVLRYGVSSGVHRVFGASFPFGTLTVNIFGCFAMGLLYALLMERMDVEPAWRAAIFIGVLGAFTTFSSFSMETLNLLELGEHERALLNIIVSVLGCLLVCWAGLVIGRRL